MFKCLHQVVSVSIQRVLGNFLTNKSETMVHALVIFLENLLLATVSSVLLVLPAYIGNDLELPTVLSFDILQSAIAKFAGHNASKF